MRRLLVARIGKLKNLAMVVAMLLSLLAGGLTTVVARAVAPPTLTGGTDINDYYDTNISISDLQVSAVPGTEVSVHLFVENGDIHLAETSGIIFDSGTNEYSNSMYFHGDVADVNTALASIYYYNGEEGVYNLEASLVGPGQIYYPGNGHIYEVVAADEGITAEDAQIAAAASSLGGIPGYLMTSTSEEENSFLGNRLLSGGAWMGASDATSEGDWKWISGPENDTSFWSGDGDTGSPVEGQYSNWSPGEPNDQSGEDCAQFYPLGWDEGGIHIGRWNDLPCSGSTLDNYVVEYGTDGDLPPAISSQDITITLTKPAGNNITISSCDELLDIDDEMDNRFNNYKLEHDIDCSEVENFLPIGMDENGWYDDDAAFEGSFDGQGHTISNLNIDHPDNWCAGLFLQTYGAEIKNLVLSDGSVNGGDCAGSLVGWSYNTTITNVKSNLDVISEYQAGGLIGFFEVEGVDITHSGLVYDGSVSGDEYVGGLYGEVDVYDGDNFTLERSYSEGSVNAGGEYVGGLVGYVYIENDDGHDGSSFVVQNSYSHADVYTEYDEAGGLIGYGEVYNDDTGNETKIQIDKSYSSGEVYSDGDNAGGLIGSVYDLYYSGEKVLINDSFAAGNIVSDSNDCSFAIIGSCSFLGEGDYDGELTLNYVLFDENRTGQDMPAYIDTNGWAAVDGNEDPNYFINNTANIPLNAWDFDAIWQTQAEDFPIFRPFDYVPPVEEPEGDNDGVTTVVEDAAPNEGDANNDGTTDSQQDNVASFVDPVTEKYAVLETSCTSVTEVGIVAESGTTKDSAFDYPVGLMNLTIECGQPGATATVTQYYYGNFDASKMVPRKYNPTTKQYTTIPGAVVTNVTIDGNAAIKAVYSITDGGPLDQDGATNGIIVDPSGPALNVVAAPNTGLGGLFFIKQL